MNELMKALRPVKGRIRLDRLLRGAAAGFAAGAAAALVLLAVTLFVPLEGRWAAAGMILGGCVLLSAAGNALRPVKDAEAARTADACGLQERAVTALEMAKRGPAEGRAAEMIEAQRQDACAHLRKLDVRKIRLRIPKAWLCAGAGLLVLCAGTLLISGQGDRILAERKAFSEKTAAMAEKIDEAAAEEEKGITEKEKAELRKLTEELKRDLEASRDELDAMVALDKAEQQLEKLHAEQTGEKTSGDAAAHSEAMDALAQAMQDAGMDPGTSLTALSSEELQSLAEGLTGEAKELAEQLAQAAQQGSLTDAQIQAAAAAQGGDAAQASALQQALSGMKASLGGEGSQSSGAGASGAGNGSQGQNGGGAGTGSTNEEQKGGGPSQQGGTAKGNRPAEYKEAEYERIYDPEKAEAATRDVTTEQNSLEKDSVQIETGPGKGTLEGSVPFREVIGEYAQQEAQAAESAHLTREQQEWVDEYFRKLTEE